MTSIRCIKSGLIYKNAIPHVYSRHTAHPSIALLSNDEMLATAVIGQAFEAPDSRTYLFRSFDKGETWIQEGLLFNETGENESDLGRISVSPKGDLVAVYFKHNRSRKDQGYTNPENMGFIETEIFLTKSLDNGKTWQKPWRVDPPIIGPAFESQSAITFLHDGRWLLLTSTWRGWDGYCPNGMKVVAFVSYDEGKTWPEYLDIMGDTQNNIIFFESCICELEDKRLLATAWAYDEKNKLDLMNQYVISEDGKKFGPLLSTALQGQTMTTMPLGGIRLLSVYRRMDQQGLWANLETLEENRWKNESAIPLWGTMETDLVQTGSNMASNFARLKFGSPRMIRLENEIFIAFWCYEDYQGVIRWFKLEVDF